jgi:hypothetical protein
VEPDSTAGFKQRALVEMQEKAKGLVRNNKNELSPARTLEVSLDRAGNVIEGGPGAAVADRYRRCRGDHAGARAEQITGERGRACTALCNRHGA